MGMYALIEDAMNKRFDDLVAGGMTEDEAAERMADEAGSWHERVQRLEQNVFPGDFAA